VRLTDVTQPAAGAAGNYPNQPALIAACQAQAVTPAAAGTDIYSAQLSVTENAGAKAALASKLGSSTRYNYAPVPTYTLIGGYQDRVFGNAAANGDITHYCIYWPSYNAVLGKTGGGTNKWAKPIIKDVSTATAFTNTPAGTAGFFDLPAGANAAAAAAAANARTAALFRLRYQETITVNYVKSGPPAGSI